MPVGIAVGLHIYHSLSYFRWQGTLSTSRVVEVRGNAEVVDVAAGAVFALTTRAIEVLVVADVIEDHPRWDGAELHLQHDDVSSDRSVPVARPDADDAVALALSAAP